MHVDPGAVPDQKTLALVNTYIIGVVRSLNDFSTACEQSLSTVHTSLQTAEARLASLEAQLASAAPAPAANAVASTHARPPAADSRDGLSPGASAHAAAVDDAVAAATQPSTDWDAEASAAAGMGVDAGDSNSDSAEGGAGMDGLRP